jgi:CubicO group peptidase (beta-lactamase class C family)
MKNKSFQMLSLVLAALLLIECSGLYRVKAAQPASPETHAAIDGYVKDQMQKLNIPGAALAIVQGDQIEYQQGYGVADSAGRAMTPQTPFMLASLSKSFTAVAIMQLAEAGKLDLDAPIQKYLTWFRVADEKASAEITVRQLLNQNSGFSELDGNKLNLETSMANDALVTSMKRLTTTTLNNVPGAAYEYSNLNYGLLGAIVETISGQPYETYIQQNIFEPLEMKHSYTSLSEAMAGGATSGFYPIFGLPLAYENSMPYSRAVTPWAGLFSSAEDMAHYLIAHLNDGRYRGKSILSPAGLVEVHKPGVQIDKWSGYAMGWWVGPDFDIASHDQASYSAPIVFSHEGGWASFRTVAILEPQRKVGVVVLMNTTDPAIDSAFGSLGWDVLSIYLGNQPAYYPPGEGFIRQHARVIFAVVNLLLLASLVWFIRKLRHWGQSPLSAPRWRLLLGYVVMPLAVDLFIAWYLLAKELPQAKSTVWLTLRMAPDIGSLIILTLLFTIGWGTIRTLLVLRALFRNS